MYIIVVLCILIILVVSFIWIVAVKLYPGDRKPYVDSSSNRSDSQPVREQENNDDRMEEENSENKNQAQPPNNILEPQDKTKPE